MSIKSEKKNRNIQLWLGILSARLIIPALISAGALVTTARAKTLLDPRPENSTTHFGYSIAVVGDLDGDGVPDLAVGARFQDGDFTTIEPHFGPPQNVGKVWLVSGATFAVINQLNDPQFQVIQDQHFGGQLGTSVASAGDINGDGFTDILVGNPHHNVAGADETEFNVGQAFVFSGKDATILLTLDDATEQESERFGESVAGLGDVNGDGVPDLLVGIPKKDSSTGIADTGAAYVISGSDGSLIRELDPPAAGGRANGRFGSAVANAGDVNGDGVSDILIGSPGRSRAFVFNGANGALILTIISPTPERLRSFGLAVAGGKDLDGDGIPDVVIGAPNQNDLNGAAYTFSGSDGHLLRTLRATGQAFARFGSFVALSADMTGDGRADVLVGAPDQTVNGLLNAGELFIFNGSTGRLFKSVTSATPKAFAGFGFAAVTGDFNNDGILDTVVGAPFLDADLINENGDLQTHLQIGQIELP